MPSSAELVCIDPMRVREVWPHVSPLLKAACCRTKLNAFADIEADILSGRSLLWMAWNGRTVESAAATILINSEIGRVCIITVCGGSDMKRWLPLIDQIEAYLKGFFGNPYNIPLGGGMPFFLTTAPNSSFVFPYGQAVSRVTYATLFAGMGTTFGNGDGSTTFNLPDLRGRVPAGKDNMGGSAASRLTSMTITPDGNTLGAASANNQTNTLAANQIPSLTSVNASQAISVISTVSGVPSGLSQTADIGNGILSGPAKSGAVALGAIISTGSNSISVAYTNGSQQVVPNIQPTIICNYILRII